MWNKVAVMAMVFTGFYAHAQNKSETFYQTAAGQRDFSVAAAYAKADVRPKNGTTDLEIKSMLVGVHVERGINEMFSVAGSMIYSAQEVNVSPKHEASGLRDPQIALRGWTSLGAARLRFGGDFSFGFEKLKIGNAGIKNAASGGHQLAPYVGLDADLGAGILGARLQYDIQFDRTAQVDGFQQDVTIEGGNETRLMAFYEMFWGEKLLGGVFRYSKSEHSTGPNGSRFQSGYDSSGISIYARLPFTSFDLVPRLDYDFSHSEADKYNLIAASVVARFGF